MKRMVMVAALAACGGGAMPRATTGNTAAASATGERVPCPDAAAVAQLAAKVWGSAPTDFGPPACGTFVRQGDAFWLIAGYTQGAAASEDEPAKVLLRLALVTPSGEVTWTDDEEWEAFEVERYQEGAFRGVDLDGDGTDELLHEGTSDHHGESETHLFVARLAGDSLVPVEGESILLSTDNIAAVVDESEQEVLCTGTLTFVPAGKAQHIHVDYSGDCEATALTVELRGDTLAVVGAPST